MPLLGTTKLRAGPLPTPHELVCCGALCVLAVVRSLPPRAVLKSLCSASLGGCTDLAWLSQPDFVWIIQDGVHGAVGMSSHGEHREGKVQLWAFHVDMFYGACGTVCISYHGADEVGLWYCVYTLSRAARMWLVGEHAGSWGRCNKVCEGV